MNFNITKILRRSMPLALLLLAACGGGTTTPATTPAATITSYTVGGSVTGLASSVVLQDNNSNNLINVAANGVFVFPAKNANGDLYSVSVFSQPTGQTCSVSTGTGTVSGNNVSNVAVVCATNAYNVGGNVTGLTGSVVLQDNSGDNLTITANGAFTFATKVANGSAYGVTVLTQPSATMNCSVANGAGTISLANVSNVAINCATNTYSVGGTASGLNGSVVLQDNGADNLTVSVNGPFNFPTAVTYGNSYSATILTQPVNQHCMVSSGAGSVSANVANIATSCINLMGGTVAQGVALSLSSASAVPAVSTVAGAAPGADGTGASANFNSPQSSVSDGTNLYVADSNNYTIRQIVIATGATTTLAGTAGMWGNTDGIGAAARFNQSDSITLVGGNLYVADMWNYTIRKIEIATGTVTTVAGSGHWGYADATGTAAWFSPIAGITTDGTNLYVTDKWNYRIREISPAPGETLSTMTAATALVTTLAANFGYPHGITTDGTNLYVADTWGGPRIREITPAAGATLSTMTSATAVVSTLAGNGNYGVADGTGTAAAFTDVTGMTTDGVNLYLADSGNNKIRQIVIASGIVSSYTGVANIQMGSGAADGAGTAATFNNPQGITLSGGNLYVSDTDNNTIRQIAVANQAVITLAGAAWGADGSGAAARFNTPGYTTTDGVNLYVADSNDYTIRKIVIATGAVTTLAGQAGQWGFVDGVGAESRFGYPMGITTDGTNLYVADQGNYTIRQIVIATGAVTTLAGSGQSGSADGTGATATFYGATGITTDGANLYVAEQWNHTIRKIVIATRVVTTLAGSANSSGSTDGTGTAALFNYPTGITTDGTNLYVTDSNNNKIRQIVIATGVVSSFTGTTDTSMGSGAADDVATAATFSWPQDITTDGTNLYVADSGNNKIRQIVIATGVVSSLTGTANTSMGSGTQDGTASTALLSYPTGVTSDGQSLYVVDSSNNTLRKIQ